MSRADAKFLRSQAIRRIGGLRLVIRCARQWKGRGGTTCRSLIYGSTSSTSVSPSFDPSVATVQARLARTSRSLDIECPQCAGQRPHGRARWRAAPGDNRSVASRSQILCRRAPRRTGFRRQAWISRRPDSANAGSSAGFSDAVNYWRDAEPAGFSGGWWRGDEDAWSLPSLPQRRRHRPAPTRARRRARSR